MIILKGEGISGEGGGWVEEPNPPKPWLPDIEKGQQSVFSAHVSKKNKRSSPLLLVDYSGRWDRRFHFEKVVVVDASLPEALIASP